MSKTVDISIVTPAFNEAENLPVLYDRLNDIMKDVPFNWEWVVVDDRSRDSTFAVLTEMAKSGDRIRVYRFSRNFGSHAAITCGLANCTGEAAIVMAADMQDPPESIPMLVEKWKTGANVVWAARRKRLGESISTRFFARLYYWIIRNIASMPNMPATGADFFLLDRSVIDALTGIEDRNTSIMALITWLGFNQQIVEYDKQARLHGETGWTFSKKFKLAVDSIAGFSYLPIRFISLLGLIIAFCGFMAALVVIYNAIMSNLVIGWASIMVVLLVLNGLQMIMLGVLGEYIWRGLDEARGRPKFIVQDTLNASKPSSLDSN